MTPFTAPLHQYTAFFRDGFLAWLDDNEAIYRQFEQQAFMAINAGRTRFSARTIIHELRDRTEAREIGAWSQYKINNNHSPDLARVFVILHPQYLAFWEYRRTGWAEFIEAMRPAIEAL
jgi:hypothetical protein